MASGRLKFIRKGFEKILCCEGTKEVVSDAADKIAIRANSRNRFGGTGYNTHMEYQCVFGSRRVEYWVRATDEAAKKAESEDKALTRSI